jgi:hypothetical protein
MNNLRIDLTGKVVTVIPKYLKDVTDSRFLCEGGFGCHPDTNGTSIYGKWLVDGEEDTIKGFMVDKEVKE